MILLKGLWMNVSNILTAIDMNRVIIKDDSNAYNLVNIPVQAVLIEILDLTTYLLELESPS